jgi:hypothetical protein
MHLHRIHMRTKWMSLEDVIKEYGLFHMYFETRPCQIGTMLGGCKRTYKTKLCSENYDDSYPSGAAL